jgi:oxygen-independent coproporphyrinogen-3 oxidase
LQTLADWRESLERAISHSPEHLSAYALSVGEETPLAGMIARGELPAPDEDTQAEMFLETGERLRAAGYARYEISNFGRPGFACRHNLGYWSGADYLGLGAGAHSYVGGVRWANCDDPERYVARMSAGALPVERAERLGRSDRKLERLALALRTTEGLALGRYADEFGPDAVEELRTQELEAAGLVVRRNGALALTEQGRPVANEVLLRLMS